jgi:hypothetical protein
MSTNGPAHGVLASKDANSTLGSGAQQAGDKSGIKSMEYHRQVLQSKVQNGECVTYPGPLLACTTHADSCGVLQNKAIHIAVGQHLEPVFCEVECVSQQAGWEVSISRSLSVR